MAKSKIYVVYVGRQPGLYETWDECRAEVEGYPGARYKSFYSKEEAVMSMRESDASASMALRQIARHLQEDTPEVVAPRTKKASPSSYPPEVILNSLAVDAGCMGNPGIMEYRGVYVQTGQEVFKVGPYHDGTNNIGEFLAIVHALALMEQRGIKGKVIYSDSYNAALWVKKRKCKTTLVRDARTAKLHEVIARAENWLLTHPCATPVLKWDTAQWGEIPADFGRK